MTATEQRVPHRVTRLLIVGASVFLLVGSDAGTTLAGGVVTDSEIRGSVATDDEGDIRSEPGAPEVAADEDVIVTHECPVDTYGSPCPPACPSRDPEVPAFWKLGRGFHNLVFGFPAEVARNPVIEILKADTIFGVGAAATEGVLIGVGKGFWRVGAGFLDIVTFPGAFAPWYHCEYLPPDPF